MPEYVGNWTTMLAYCTFCKLVFQNMHDAAKHEQKEHGRVVEPLDPHPVSFAIEGGAR